MNEKQLQKPPANTDHRVEFELAYHTLPDDERMRSTFEHDRFPVREIYPTFEDAMERANEPEFDHVFDIVISEVDSEMNYIDSWKVQS